MLRLKTREEFEAEGWKILDGNGKWYPPVAIGAVHGSCITEQMIDEGPCKEVVKALQHGARYTGGTTTSGRHFTWDRKMFVEEDDKHNHCGCEWKRHPLFCRCG